MRTLAIEDSDQIAETRANGSAELFPRIADAATLARRHDRADEIFGVDEVHQIRGGADGITESIAPMMMGSAGF
jgi:hypothetical protein